MSLLRLSLNLFAREEALLAPAPAVAAWLRITGVRQADTEKAPQNRVNRTFLKRNYGIFQDNI